jgi:hypothetical protein
VASAAAQTRRLWYNAALAAIYGAVVCAQCHPPADAALVAAWEGEDMETTIDTKERMSDD